MRRKNVLKLLIMVFAVMLFITACSPAPSAEPEPETTQEEQSPTEEPAVPEEEVANEMSTPEMDFDLGEGQLKSLPGGICKSQITTQITFNGLRIWKH